MKRSHKIVRLLSLPVIFWGVISVMSLLACYIKAGGEMSEWQSLGTFIFGWGMGADIAVSLTSLILSVILAVRSGFWTYLARVCKDISDIFGETATNIKITVRPKLSAKNPFPESVLR